MEYLQSITGIDLGYLSGLANHEFSIGQVLITLVAGYFGLKGARWGVVKALAFIGVLLMGSLKTASGSVKVDPMNRAKLISLCGSGGLGYGVADLTGLNPLSVCSISVGGVLLMIGFLTAVVIHANKKQDVISS